MTPPPVSAGLRLLSSRCPFRLLLALGLCLSAVGVGAADLPPDCVQIDSGILQGANDAPTGVRSFKGIPFAAPPVGDLRWKEPQSVAPWEGPRPALKFGPRAMQRPIFSDMPPP